MLVASNNILELSWVATMPVVSLFPLKVASTLTRILLGLGSLTAILLSTFGCRASSKPSCINLKLYHMMHNLCHGSQRALVNPLMDQGNYKKARPCHIVHQQIEQNPPYALSYPEGYEQD